VRVVDFFFSMIGALAEEAIELVDEEIDGLVRIFARGCSVEVRAADFDFRFGHEASVHVGRFVVFDIEAQPDDMVFVSEQPGGFFRDGVSESVREFEVDPADNQAVRSR
jgi:hypothetical protein